MCTDTLVGNLRFWSVTSNVSRFSESGHVERVMEHKSFIAFYKFSVAGVCSTGENDVFKALDSNEVFGEFDTPVELEAQFEEEDQRYKKATRDRTKAYRVEYRVAPGWDSFVDIIEISNTENIMQKIQSYFENRKESVTVVNLTEIESIHECIKYVHDTYISLLQRKCPVCKAKEIISELLAYLLNRYLIRWVKYDRW